MDFCLLLKIQAKIFVKRLKKSSRKYSQNLLDHAKKSATDPLKISSKRATQKTGEATGDLIGNKIANKITKFSKTLLNNNSETINNEHDKKIPKERYISPDSGRKTGNY